MREGQTSLYFMLGNTGCGQVGEHAQNTDVYIGVTMVQRGRGLVSWGRENSSPGFTAQSLLGFSR